MRLVARPVLLFLLAVLPASAKDAWSEPFAGVRHLHRVTDDPKYDIYLCFIDLTEPSNRPVVTTQEDRGMSTVQWAKKKNVQIATNGGMGGRWDGYAEPSGLTMGEGKLWTDVRHKEGAHKEYGSFAEGGGRIAFFDPGVLAKPEAWMRNIVIGTAILLKEGKPNPDMTDLSRMNPRHPRTAVAATKDLKTLMMLVVDGRQKQSIGMTGKDMQKLFMEFGAWTALNFDGGGSSCMYMEGEGVLNKPSDGRPRPVSTHLGIYAQKGKGPPKGQVKGFVREQGTEKPLAGAKVALSPAYFDTTDEKGYFHLSQVPAGEARLTVTLDGFIPGQIRAKIEAGAQAEATAELAPKAAAASSVVPTAGSAR